LIKYKIIITMAFAIKSIADLKSIFPYSSPPKISPNGERPNFGTLRVFQQQLNANAAAVTSHLEGVGYLGLVLSEEAYLEIDGISEPYERLTKPTRGETNGLTGPQLANVQQVYEEKLKSWDRENMVEKALQAIVLEAVDADYIECLKHDLLGFSMVSTLDIMAYLWETYGEMEGSDGNTLEVKMKEDWPEGTVSKLFKKMREGAAFFKLAGEPLSEKTLARWTLTVIEESKRYPQTVLEWKNLGDNEREWTRMEAHFRKGERNETTTPTSIHNINTVSTTELSVVTEQLTALQARVEELSQASNNRRNQASRPRRPVQFAYCHTHGYTSHQNRHTSAECRSPAEGHMTAASTEDTMGGSTAGAARYRRANESA
jgi:hypothetical protein